MTCTVCNSQHRVAIDQALIGMGKFGSLRNIAKQYGLHASSVYRHLHNCLPAGIQEITKQVTASVESKSILQQMAELHQRTLALLDKAEASNDLHVALRAVREARGNLELLGRLDGSLDGPVGPTSGDVNITVQYVDKAVILPSATPPMLPPGD
jgi:transposase